jgi:stage V sporulation protein AE
MEILLTYLKVFVTGGALCLVGQLLMNYTKLTPARILIIFVLAGAFLEAVNLYQPIVDFGKAGATIPIIGFGYSLAKGAIEGAKTGFLEAFSAGFKAVTIGIGSAILFAYVFSLFFRSKTKQ